MVSTLFLDRSFNNLFNDFFYSWPTETKPPIERYPIYEENSDTVVGFGVQMALSGFSKENLEVWWDEKLIHIKGNNSSTSKISDRFKCDFHHKFSYSKNLDVSQSKVIFENGMLIIEIPVVEKKATKNYLLGG